MSLDLSAMARVWTDEALDELDEQYRYEIVDGHLLVSPRPANPHVRTAAVLTRALITALPTGYDVWAEPSLRLATSSRSPDLAVVRPSAIADIAFVLAAEVFLAVEIVSPSSVGEDKIRKPAEYAAAGIPAYWFVEPGTPPMITAFVLDGGAYRLVSGPSPVAELPWPVDLR